MLINVLLFTFWAVVPSNYIQEKTDQMWHTQTIHIILIMWIIIINNPAGEILTEPTEQHNLRNMNDTIEELVRSWFVSRRVPLSSQSKAVDSLKRQNQFVNWVIYILSLNESAKHSAISHSIHAAAQSCCKLGRIQSEENKNVGQRRMKRDAHVFICSSSSAEAFTARQYQWRSVLGLDE